MLAKAPRATTPQSFRCAINNHGTATIVLQDHTTENPRVHARAKPAVNLTTALYPVPQSIAQFDPNQINSVGPDWVIVTDVANTAHAFAARELQRTLSAATNGTRYNILPYQSIGARSQKIFVLAVDGQDKWAAEVGVAVLPNCEK